MKYRLLLLLLRVWYYLKIFDIQILFMVYQRSSDFVHKHLGINCFTLSHIAFIMSFMFNVGRGFLLTGKVHPFIVGIAGTIYVPFYLLSYRDGTRTKPGFFNPLIETQCGFRLVTVMMVIPLGIMYLHNKSVIRLYFGCDELCYISSFYWLACLPQTPGKSTLKKLLEKLSPSPAPEMAYQEQ